jgi:dolichol kinase
MWLAVGYAAASWFPAPAPAAGILVGALADPAAAFGGALIGSTDKKTWVGTVVHFGVGVALLRALPGPWHVAVVAALAGALVERWSGPLNDNATVPLAVAFVFAILG